MQADKNAWRILPLEPQQNDGSDFENIFFEDSEIDHFIQIIRAGFDITDHISMEEIEHAFEKLCERMANEQANLRQSTW